MLYGCAALLGVEFLEGLLGLRGRPLLLSLSAILVMATVSMFVLAIVLYKQLLTFLSDLWRLLFRASDRQYGKFGAGSQMNRRPFVRPFDDLSGVHARAYWEVSQDGADRPITNSVLISRMYRVPD